MVLQTPGLDVAGGVRQLLIVQNIRVGPQGQLTLHEALVERPNVVVVGHVKGAVELGIRRAGRTHAAHAQHIGTVDAFGQPDAAGTYLLHLTAGLTPEVQRYTAGHVAAEAVYDGGPLLQRVDLVRPQITVGIIQIHHVPPVRHLAGGLPRRVAEEILRVGVGQHGVRRGVVIHHVDDALHTPPVDSVHQMDKVLPCAVFRVDAPVVLNGVGTAQRALAALCTDGMDGHKPDDVRAQPVQTIQIVLQRPERALLRVVADKDAVDYLMQQVLIRVFCHDVYLLTSEAPEIHPLSGRGYPAAAPSAACRRRFPPPPHRWSSSIRSRTPCRPAFQSSLPPRRG